MPKCNLVQTPAQKRHEWGQRFYRALPNETHGEIAKGAGIHKNTVCVVRDTGNISFTTFCKIANAYFTDEQIVDFIRGREE